MGLDIVVMGVSGSGKSTVGAALAGRLGVPFGEGDEFHSEAARTKMASGVPLDDDDRWPWLRRVRRWMDEQDELDGGGCVVACSALRRAYRDILRSGRARVVFCWLSVDEASLRSRMTSRVGHYMPVCLLSSQLSTLEPLAADEDGLELPAGHTPEETVARVLDWLEADADVPGRDDNSS